MVLAKSNAGFREWGRQLKHKRMAMEMFQQVMEHKRYRSMFIARAIEGELHPSLEQMMFHYILGKPTETIDLNVNDQREDLTVLTEPQLKDRVLQLQGQLESLNTITVDNKAVN